MTWIFFRLPMLVLMYSIAFHLNGVRKHMGVVHWYEQEEVKFDSMPRVIKDFGGGIAR